MRRTKNCENVKTENEKGNKSENGKTKNEKEKKWKYENLVRGLSSRGTGLAFVRLCTWPFLHHHHDHYIGVDVDVDVDVDFDEASRDVDDDIPGVLPYRVQPWARLDHSHSSMILGRMLA